jgi:alkylhydroperoxidase family enzyme
LNQQTQAVRMSRLPKRTKNEVTPEIRDLYTKIGEARGNVPNMFRVVAHRPEILTTMVAHLNAVTNTGTVSVRTKELVATLVSRINRCEY